MAVKSTLLLVFILLEVTSSVPIDNGEDDTFMYIPPIITNIYQKMTAVLEQGDLEISLKYLEIVKTLHWLEPVTLGEKITIGMHKCQQLTHVWAIQDTI